MPDNREMITITRKGKTTELTGWRAWLAGAVVLIALALVALLVVLLLWGITISLTVILLVVVPVAILFALVSALFQSGGSPDTKRKKPRVK